MHAVLISFRAATKIANERLLEAGLGHNLLNPLADLLVQVVSLDDESGKDRKRDSDEQLHRNHVIHVRQLSLNTTATVLLDQTCSTLGTVNSLARQLEFQNKVPKIEISL